MFVSLAAICALCIHGPALAQSLTVDRQVTTHQSSASNQIVSPSFSTSAGNELLLAFITSDGPGSGKQTFSSVMGGGLTWSLRKRINTQPGTAEIWQAVATSPLAGATVTATRSSGSYAGSITVVTFAGADTAVNGATGGGAATSGAPSSTLTTTRSGSWVWAVGDDWDQAAARTVGAGQTKVDEYLPSVGDTFWVQRMTSPTASSGTAVTINDTAPTGDRWNLALIEVLPGVSDSVPPSPPGSLTANAISSTRVDLGWTAANDNVGVVRYNILRNGSAIGTATGLSYSDTTAAASTTYTYTVTAQDGSGNISTPSNPATVTTPAPPPDTTPPTVSLTAPAANATVTGTIAVTASASDNVRVASVQLTLDGANLGSPITTSPYTMSWDSTTIPDGVHSFSAIATDAAGNTGSAQAVSVTVSNSAPGARGQWGPASTWPIVAMNMVLMPNGKILMWDGGPDCLGAITDYLWDPATNAFTQVNLASQPEFRDLFCSAMTVLADGRVLVAGGHECVNTNYVGAAISNMFSPYTNQWTFLPDMAYRRWYPSVITLSSGKALVIAGADRSVDSYIPIPELYDPVANTWTTLPGANLTIPDYPFIFNLPDGRVLAAGSDEAKMATYALNVATQAWTVVDPTILDAGSAVMYLPGKVMKAGSSYLSPPADNGGNVPSSPNTYVIDMAQPAPAWQQTASMAYPRTHLNLTALPDGKVLATGGSRVIGGIDPATGVLPAEMWDPATRGWTTMVNESRVRMYHSTALLLPDGRVLVAGSGHNYANAYAEFSSEIYSPPYLFKGPRPTITSVPSTPLAYGTEFFVGTPDAASIASVAFIRGGSVTHSFNMDQRYIPTAFRVVSGGLMVTPPPDANTAPPGFYMLFLVSNQGVPSVAPFVRLPAGYEDTTPPSAPANLTAAGGVGTANLSWTAATDNVGVTGYRIYRSTTSGFTPGAGNLVTQTSSTGTTYADSSLAAGTYYYRVAAIDAGGNTSPPSNEASATVTAGSSGISVDAMATTHQSSAGAFITSPTLSTIGNDEVLLAFITSDGPGSGAQTITSVTGGGLTWRLRKRINTQVGTAEIWQAVASNPLSNMTVTATRGSGSYVGSITVAAFLGASTTVDGAVAGASNTSGAPTATLTTTRAGSWVWAVGNDWDQAIARTVGGGQTKVDEYLASVGDTFWVQRMTAPTSAAGTLVTINDTSPTTDRWNLTLIEIVPR